MKSLSRTEKLLFFSPILLVAGSALVWRWSSTRTEWIDMQGFAPVMSMSFSPSGRRLAVFGTYPTPQFGRLYDVEKQNKLFDLQLTYPANRFATPAWSPDGERIATGFYDDETGPSQIQAQGYSFANQIGKVALLSASHGQLLRVWPFAARNEHSNAAVQFNEDGSRLIGFGMPAMVFDSATGQTLRRILPHGASNRAVHMQCVFNADQTLLAVFRGKQKSLEVVDVRTSESVWKSPHRVDFPNSLHWSFDGLLISTYPAPNGDHNLLLWDSKTKQLLPEPPLERVYRVATHPSQPLLAIAQRYELNHLGGAPPQADATLVVWDRQKAKALWEQELGNQPVDNGVEWSPNGHWLTLKTRHGPRESNQRRLRVFSRTGVLKYDAIESDGNVTAWSADSRQLAIGEKDGVKLVPFPA